MAAAAAVAVETAKVAAATLQVRGVAHQLLGWQPGALLQVQAMATDSQAELCIPGNAGMHCHQVHHELQLGAVHMQGNMHVQVQRS
jgi:hypothetical protein